MIRIDTLLTNDSLSSHRGHIGHARSSSLCASRKISKGLNVLFLFLSVFVDVLVVNKRTKEDGCDTMGWDWICIGARLRAYVRPRSVVRPPF